MGGDIFKKMGWHRGTRIISLKPCRSMICRVFYIPYLLSLRFVTSSSSIKFSKGFNFLVISNILIFNDTLVYDLISKNAIKTYCIFFYIKFDFINGGAIIRSNQVGNGLILWLLITEIYCGTLTGFYPYFLNLWFF